LGGNAISQAKVPFIRGLSSVVALFAVVAAVMDWTRGFYVPAVVELGAGLAAFVISVFRKDAAHTVGNARICAICLSAIFFTYPITQLQDLPSAFWAPIYPFLIVFVAGSRRGFLWVASWFFVLSMSFVARSLTHTLGGFTLEAYIQLLLTCSAAYCAARFYERGHRFQEQKQNITAKVDPLTGIFNRRSFYGFLRSEMDRSITSGWPCSILILDIDHFKVINDTYGHGVGDEVLKEFVAVIQHHKSDLALFARLGGEEFALLLPERPLEAAYDMAERLCAAVANHTFVTGPVTCSIGAAEYTDGSDRELLAAADRALYEAKDLGRNRVCVAQRNMNGSLTQIVGRRKWRSASLRA
jgi:diguanylate cyclase (GGDEF)-like protein